MRLLFISFFFVAGFSLAYAQEEKEVKYFHELKGVEDSSGVTHLFYRHYYEFEQECSYIDYQDEKVSYISNLVRNNVRYFNTKEQSDTLRYREGERMWPECSTTYEKIFNYKIFDNDPSKIFRVYSGDAYWYGPTLSDWRGNTLSPGWGAPHVIGIDTIKNKILIPTWLSEVVVKRKSDVSNTKVTFSANLDGSNWNEFDIYDEVPDSLIFDFSLQAVNPHSNNEYFVVKGDSLLRSLNHGDSLDFVYEDEIFTSVSAEVLFPLSSETYYFIYKNNINNPFTKSLWKLSYNETEWDFRPIEFNDKVQAIFLDNSDSGKLYVAVDSEVITSVDQAENFKSFLNFEQEITGLYKKPNSDILYVLTREELLEVDTKTQQTTTLKELPVSNEKESFEIPTQISLEQNYPNPFNPSTIISYQLAENSRVRLEVFDVTGRKVAVLVDGELKTTGRHQVTFDAAELSSGMYFYRLETGGKILTQKMMLVK